MLLEVVEPNARITLLSDGTIQGSLCLNQSIRLDEERWDDVFVVGVLRLHLKVVDMGIV